MTRRNYPDRVLITNSGDDITDDLANALTTIPTWTFGEPRLRASLNGQATWSRWNYQMGNTGWSAQLYGGVQAGYSQWARVMIPVNDMPIGELKSVLWGWNTTEVELNGLAMQIHLRSDTDPDLIVDVSQKGSVVALGAGWNNHTLDFDAKEFFWYGEDGPTPGGIAEGIGTFSSINDYVADVLFGTWVIYRIDFYWGAQGGDEEYKNIWLIDVRINGQVILLKPDSTGTGRIGKKFYTSSSSISTGNAKLEPKTPYRLLSVSMKLDAEQTGGSSFVLSLLSEQGTNFDPVILTDDMDVPAGRKSLYATFGQGYEFGMDDEIDLVYTNTGTKTYGLTYTYEILVD